MAGEEHAVDGWTTYRDDPELAAKTAELIASAMRHHRESRVGSAYPGLDADIKPNAVVGVMSFLMDIADVPGREASAEGEEMTDWDVEIAMISHFVAQRLHQNFCCARPCWHEMPGPRMTLSPPNAAHLSEALGADTARAVLAGKRLVSRPVQITLEELERLMNVATRRGANDDGL